ncbi:MAG TPA: hypothetical protein VFZ03_01955 [Dongiaceae bacterium]
MTALFSTTDIWFPISSVAAGSRCSLDGAEPISARKYQEAFELQQRPRESVEAVYEYADEADELHLKQLERRMDDERAGARDVIDGVGVGEDAEQRHHDQQGGGAEQGDRVDGMTGQDRVDHAVVALQGAPHPTRPDLAHAGVQQPVAHMVCIA